MLYNRLNCCLMQIIHKSSLPAPPPQPAPVPLPVPPPPPPTVERAGPSHSPGNIHQQLPAPPGQDLQSLSEEVIALRRHVATLEGTTDTLFSAILNHLGMTRGNRSPYLSRLHHHQQWSVQGLLTLQGTSINSYPPHQVMIYSPLGKR